MFDRLYFCWTDGLYRSIKPEWICHWMKEYHFIQYHQNNGKIIYHKAILVSQIHVKICVSLWLKLLETSVHISTYSLSALRWRYNERDGLSNHQPLDCLRNRLFSRRSKNPWKLRVTDLCATNSPVTGEFPAQRASNAENVSIWWRHHILWIRQGFKTLL